MATVKGIKLSTGERMVLRWLHKPYPYAPHHPIEMFYEPCIEKLVRLKFVRIVQQVPWLDRRGVKITKKGRKWYASYLGYEYRPQLSNRRAQ